MAMHDITQLLQGAECGDEIAQNELYEAVYAELRKLARYHRGKWNGDETLSATVLVHEAYIRLVQQKHPNWQSRGQFYAMASQAMRHILIDYARRRLAGKRGANLQQVPMPASLADESAMDFDTAAELLLIHSQLQQLERDHPRQARVVECQFFGGLRTSETGDALGISTNTVRRDWQLAKIWLGQRLHQGALSE